VKRDKNKLADWASNLVKERQLDIELEKLYPDLHITSNPPPSTVRDNIG
jgi:hypothetical protein